MTANWPIPVMEAGSRRTASLRGLQIHNQLKLDRHLHRKIRWLCPAKNLVNVSCGLAMRIGGHAPVGDEATALGKITPRRSYHSCYRDRNRPCPYLDLPNPKGMQRASFRPRQQCRPSPQGVEEEDAARRSLPRDDAARPL